MAPKFSVLMTAAAIAAAIPPALSYIPQTSSLFSITSPSESTPRVELPVSQPVPYANSVNQLNELTERQKAEMNNSANSNELQWKKPPVGATQTVHHVGFTPSEQPQQAQNVAGQPIYTDPSVSTAGQAPVQIIESQSPPTTVYYSEVPGQVIQTPQGV